MAPALPSSDGEFQTTQWSVVRAAAGPDPAKAQAALAELCLQYWFPIYAHIRRKTERLEEAEDLTQDFFAHLLKAEALQSLDAAHGRFRAYLLACCNHFLANERARASAYKRGGRATIVPLDFGDADRRFRLEPPDDSSTDRRFERQWALGLMEAALRDLSAASASEGNGELAERLMPMLTGDGPSGTYADIAAELNMTESAVKKRAQRLRQRFGALLRQRIASTVESSDLIEEEIRDLFQALQ